MKRLSYLLTALALVLTLAAPARAYEDYGLVCDDTGYMDPEDFSWAGETLLPTLRDTYHIDLRVDVLWHSEEDDSVENIAQEFYTRFGYGYGEERNGVTLTVMVYEDDTGLGVHSWYVYADGTSDELVSNAPANVVQMVEPYLSEEAWAGDLDSDCETCMEAVLAFADSMDSFVQSGGVAATIFDPAQSPEPTAEPDDVQVSYITDCSGTLTEDQYADLEDRAAALSEQYGCGVYVMLLDDYQDYSDESDSRSAARGLYRDWGLGWGEDCSGVLLMLSMAERDYAIITEGYGRRALNDSALQYIEEQILDDLGENDWYGGLSDYLDSADKLLAQAEKGEPYVEPEPPMARVLGVVICIALGFLVAFIVTAVLKGQLKSVAEKAEANEYVPEGGVNLTENYDQFTHTTTSRVYSPVKKDDDSDSGSSSGGTSGKF